MIWKRLLRFSPLLLGIAILGDLFCRLGAEIFWFESVGHLPAFLLRLAAQGILWTLVTGVTAVFLLGNLALAWRNSSPAPIAHPDRPPLPRTNRWIAYFSLPRRSPRESAPYPLFGALTLRWLLPLSLALSGLASFLLVHYGQIVIHSWKPEVGLTHNTIQVLGLRRFWDLGQQLTAQVGLGIGAVAFAIGVLVYPAVLLTLAAIGLSLGFGFILAKHWAIVLPFLRPTPFNSTEPLFGRNIDFYVFSFPVWELLNLWLVGLFLFGLIAVALTYLLSGDSLSQGAFAGFTSRQQRHLCGLGSALMAALALNHWLGRYRTLYSDWGVTFGAGYADVQVRLPALTVLSLLALAIAGFLLWRTLTWEPKALQRAWVRNALGLYGGLAIVGWMLPVAVEYVVVQPNELTRERPYIERTIALTRQAFGLAAIDTQTFNPQGQLTQADLDANPLTVRNIRLWDQRPLLQTNRQLQQIRPYYRFPDADIDRYTLQTAAPAQPPKATQQAAAPAPGTPTEQRQVLIAARELDNSAVPQQAQTWINRHLIYTHGYGFTLSPVNTVGPGGLPEYFVKDISGDAAGALTTSSPAIRASIPIGQPRIYFGEITNPYVITGTRTQELDYPSGSDNAYNVYQGRGGIPINTWWRRGLFSIYLRDWQVLFTRNLLPESRVLFRRNIQDRIRAIAPFLRYDSDPYLVAARTDATEAASSDLYWIVDAYTVSDRYPYSDRGSEGINYIRNSVKVIVDAYHGSVDFYISDPNDPLIRTWSALLPGMFKPLSQMPVELRSHLRYPQDFFNIQSERLMTYHMTDPQVFYNREDQWQIPNEVYGSEARPVEPYYLITSLPTVPFEEFLLLLPYTPRQRTNLIAWLAARSDGENYGKLLLYTFPKERLVYGPEQVEARINQDPVISQQISLWNRQGSRAIQGNLLVIPIEQSLLYVEPLYLEADQNSLPTLVRVIVAYENRIVMAPTLEEGLRAIFQPNVTPAPTIIRPVEEPAAAP